MGRFNRLNCMVHIWHLVRVPGTRSRRKTFGVYPSTFSALEDHRVYTVLYASLKMLKMAYKRSTGINASNGGNVTLDISSLKLCHIM